MDEEKEDVEIATAPHDPVYSEPDPVPEQFGHFAEEDLANVVPEPAEVVPNESDVKTSEAANEDPSNLAGIDESSESGASDQ